MNTGALTLARKWWYITEVYIRLFLQFSCPHLFAEETPASHDQRIFAGAESFDFRKTE